MHEIISEKMGIFRTLMHEIISWTSIFIYISKESNELNHLCVGLIGVLKVTISLNSFDT